MSMIARKTHLGTLAVFPAAGLLAALTTAAAGIMLVNRRPRATVA